jgi:4-diphosphocytidyl-2-C-methyl-D-erythritol kinase
MTRTLRISAYAKTNLYLGVGDSRPDGYHDVTTVLQTLALADSVTLTEAAERALSSEPDPVVSREQNLAWKAVDAFADHLGAAPTVAISLSKRIPAGAGLGGGSSDAAAVLAGLAHLTGTALRDPRLAAAARSLGADVPFFLLGGTALFGGRGDELVRLLPGVSADVVLVKPDVPVPTADAYRAFDLDPQVPAGPEAVTAALVVRDTAVLANALANNMEKAVFSLVPQVGEAIRWLRAQDGVLGAVMAGSGSCCFGVVGSAEEAQRVAGEAQRAGYWAVATSFRGPGVEIVEI